MTKAKPIIEEKNDYRLQVPYDLRFLSLQGGAVHVGVFSKGGAAEYLSFLAIKSTDGYLMTSSGIGYSSLNPGVSWQRLTAHAAETLRTHSYKLSVEEALSKDISGEYWPAKNDTKLRYRVCGSHDINDRSWLREVEAYSEERALMLYMHAYKCTPYYYDNDFVPPYVDSVITLGVCDD